MTRPKNEDNLNLQAVTLSLDKDQVYEFERTLTRGTSVSEAIRDFMASEIEKIKNPPMPGKASLTDHFPEWMIDWRNWAQQNVIFDSLRKEDRIKAQRMLYHAFRLWKIRNRDRQLKEQSGEMEKQEPEYPMDMQYYPPEMDHKDRNIGRPE